MQSPKIPKFPRQATKADKGKSRKKNTNNEKYKSEDKPRIIENNAGTQRTPEELGTGTGTQVETN